MCHCAQLTLLFTLDDLAKNLLEAYGGIHCYSLRKGCLYVFPLSRCWIMKKFTSCGNNCIAIWRENEEEESLWPWISWLHSDFAQDTLPIFVCTSVSLIIDFEFLWVVFVFSLFVHEVLDILLNWLWPSKICGDLYLHHWIQKPLYFFTLIVFFTHFTLIVRISCLFLFFAPKWESFYWTN